MSETIINHNTNNFLTVLRLVYMRLPMLLEEPENEAMISALTLEAMYKMEQCLKIRITEVEGNEVEDWTRVGIENNYTLPQKMIIADLVSMNIIYRIIVLNSIKTGEANAEQAQFLKKAKAGSAEVEFEQIKLKDSALFQMSPDKLLARFKAEAANGAAMQGCLIDICDNCAITFLEDTHTGIPFIVPGGVCGC